MPDPMVLSDPSCETKKPPVWSARAHVVATVDGVRDHPSTIPRQSRAYPKGFLVARVHAHLEFEADTAALRRRSSVLSPWLVLVEKWLLLHAAKYPACAVA